MPRFRNIQAGGAGTQSARHPARDPGRTRERHEAFLRSVYAPSDVCPLATPSSSRIDRNAKASGTRRGRAAHTDPPALSSQASSSERSNSGPSVSSHSHPPELSEPSNAFGYALPPVPDLLTASAIAQLTSTTGPSLPSPPPSPLGFPEFHIPSVYNFPRALVSGDLISTNPSVKAFSGSTSQPTASSSTSTTTASNLNAMLGLTKLNPLPSPFRTPTKNRLEHKRPHRVVARAHAHPYARPSTSAQADTAPHIPRTPVRQRTYSYFTAQLPGSRTPAALPPSPSPIARHRARSSRAYTHSGVGRLSGSRRLTKGEVMETPSLTRIKGARSIRGISQQELGRKPTSLMSAPNAESLYEHNSFPENQSQTRRISSDVQDEAMDVDVVIRNGDEKEDGEISPLFNMFAGTFASIPKPPPGVEHVPSFTYPAPTLSLANYSSSSSSSTEGSDMDDCESVPLAYSGRPVPSLSASAFYLPTFAYTDTAREPSASPVEIDFPAAVQPISSTASASTLSNTATAAPMPVEFGATGPDGGPSTPAPSPPASPMPITPPALPMSSSTFLDILETTLTDHTMPDQSQACVSVSTQDPRRRRSRPHALRTPGSSTSSMTQPREREPGARYLRRVVPKPHSSRGEAVSSLRSPPLEYPYPYAAIDRPYSTLTGGEEGRLAERLSLMNVGPMGATFR